MRNNEKILMDPLKEYAKCAAKEAKRIYRKTQRKLRKEGFTKEEARIMAAVLVNEAINGQIARNFYGPSPLGD